MGCIQGHDVKQEYPAGKTQILNNTMIMKPWNGSYLELIWFTPRRNLTRLTLSLKIWGVKQV